MVIPERINSPPVIRFSGQPLPASPRIAVFANDAIGNFVVTTPLLQMLRDRYPNAELAYFGGERTAELEKASDLANTYVQLLGAQNQVALLNEWTGWADLTINVEQTALTKVASALVVNEEGFVCGPAMGLGGRGDFPFAPDQRGDLWRDKQWISESLTATYPFLRSGFIGELFCRLAYLDGPIPGYKLPETEPDFDVPDVIVSASASLPEKLWPFEKWSAVLHQLRGTGRTIGLVGAKPAEGAKHWKGGEAEQQMVDEGLVRDLRGRVSLPGVVGVLSKAELVLTIDNGILHLACGTVTPTVGLYRFGIHRLWAPPKSNLLVVHPGSDVNVHEIPVNSVWEAIERAL